LESKPATAANAREQPLLKLDALEVNGIVEARRGLRENVGEPAGGLEEFAPDVGEKIPLG
jgi:hypothetical protein